MKFTIDQIRHATLVTFKSDFKQACKELFDDENYFIPMGNFNLMHFIMEYGDSNDAIGVVEYLVHKANN